MLRILSMGHVAKSYDAHKKVTETIGILFGTTR